MAMDDLQSAFAQSLHDYIGVGLWQTLAGRLLFWSGILLCILVICLALAWILVKKYNTKLSAYELAKRELKDLGVRRTGDKRLFQAWYFDLLMVLKRYFSERSGLPVVDKTDAELVVLVSKLFPVQQQIEQLLMASQGVRFANESAIVEQADKDLKLAEQIVELCEQKMQQQDAELAKVRNKTDAA